MLSTPPEPVRSVPPAVCLVMLATLALASLGACVSSVGRSSPKTDAQRYIRLAQLQLERGQTQKAIESTRKAISLDSDSADAESFLGLIYLTTSEFKEAAKQFRRALRINPYLTDAHNALGVAYRELGDYDRALEEFGKALKDRAYVSPEKVHLNLGHLHLKRDDHKRAIASFREALAVRPEYLGAILGLGMAYQAAGRTDLARKEFGRLVRAAPESPEAGRARMMLEPLVKQEGP